MKYCEAIHRTKRRPTRCVMVGNVGVGGDNPIRIQSMTTSNTRDAAATIEQIIKLADAGCEIARVTVQGMKEAEACEQIRNGLLQRGYMIPLVADIHFFPPAALKVADFVDKVRINPGNYADKRASFKIIEYNDNSYAKELEKIEEKFTPLVEKCKELKRAMRIGTNHGSLSDRIMNRYGDTPRGMVESALEFAKICRKNDYHNFMFSMKSSNPQVMILAYRLLVAEMYELEWDYPLHLGVTEAGEGEDGRIKSAMGIGSLLLDGIGDTVRVSLTEDPWHEIDPCQRLVRLSEGYLTQEFSSFDENHRNFKEIKRRPVIFSKEASMHRNGTVIVSVKSEEFEDPDIYRKLGCDLQLERPKLKIASVDNIVLKEWPKDETLAEKIKQLEEIGLGVISNVVPLRDLKKRLQTERFVVSVGKQTPIPFIIKVTDETILDWVDLKDVRPAMIFLNPTQNRVHYARQFFEWLQEENIQVPVILNFSYTCTSEDLIIAAAAECGALLCDGLGEGIYLEAPYDVDFLRNLSFGILQAARMRTSKTDFISCPSCGRTLFDLQDVTKRIRARTSHLPGVKIAIMGCIVNGPGEMADADFGYVGSKPGMIDLYVGKQCVQRDIPFSEADDRLLDLIKAHGRWIEAED
jgi:(E)-4-hydroxy-3-methylbut-2-enyl-diphosphate synthase